MKHKLIDAALVIVTVVAFWYIAQQLTPANPAIAQAKQQAELARIQQETQIEQERTATVAPWQTGMAVFYTVLPGMLLFSLFGLAAFTLQRHFEFHQPDENGLYGAHRSTLIDGQLVHQTALAHHEAKALAAANSQPRVPQTLTYSPAFRNNQEGLPSGDPLANMQLPTAPSWAQLTADGFKPTVDRVLLGYANSGPVYSPLAGLLSTALIGRSGQGKSTALRMCLLQTLLVGGKVAALDPHGSLAGDVGGVPMEFVATSASELDQAAAWMVRELETRMTQFRSGQRDFVPVLALCDEFPVISMSSKAAVAAVGRWIFEGRKVNCHALVSSQGANSGQFGTSMYRDGLSSRFVFRCSTRQAGMAGLEKEALDLVHLLSPGKCILSGPTDEPTIVAIPNVLASDLEGLSAGASKPTNSALQAAGSVLEALPEALTEEQQEARIMAMIEAGATKNRIITEVFGVSGGRAYQQASKVVDDVRSRWLESREQA